MKTVTLNLLGALGVTDQRRLKHSPALTLSEEGILTIWDEWHHSQSTASPGPAPKRNSVDKWLSHHKVVDITRVRKILYKEDLEIFVCGKMDMSTLDTGIYFFLGAKGETNPYFTLDPLWLGVPQFQEFLSQYMHPGIPNDFDPQRQWLLQRQETLNLFDKESSTLKNTSTVIGRLGAITWEHETAKAEIRIYPYGRWRRHAPIYLLLESGHLSPLK